MEDGFSSYSSLYDTSSLLQFCNGKLIARFLLSLDLDNLYNIHLPCQVNTIWTVTPCVLHLTFVTFLQSFNLGTKQKVLSCDRSVC